MGDGQERTEEATPKKRRDARKKGTVAKSIDLVNAIVILALLLVLPFSLSQIGGGMVLGMNGGLRNLPTSLDPRTMSSFIWGVVQPTIGGLAVIVLTAMLVGVAVNFAQVGFVMSSEPLSPSLAKLNPINGLKRLLSRQSLFDGGKAVVKSVVFGLIAWTAIASEWATLARLSYLPPLAGLSVVASILKALAIKVAIAWLVLAVLDYFFQRKQTDKQLRMTKEEVKQEMKESETSAELKMAMAQRRRKLSKSRVSDAVKQANVVITNPTHFAVALAYDPEKDSAPRVVAKGQDFLAAKIRELANENRIPIVPNPPLARALYKKCEIGDAVPTELFQAVAEVLAYVYRTLKRVRESA